MLKSKKLWGLLLVLFLGYWMIQEPDSLIRTAGDGIRYAWDLLKQLFAGLIRFFSEL